MRAHGTVGTCMLNLVDSASYQHSRSMQDNQPSLTTAILGVVEQKGGLTSALPLEIPRLRSFRGVSAQIIAFSSQLGESFCQGCWSITTLRQLSRWVANALGSSGDKLLWLIASYATAMDLQTDPRILRSMSANIMRMLLRAVNAINTTTKMRHEEEKPFLDDENYSNGHRTSRLAVAGRERYKRWLLVSSIANIVLFAISIFLVFLLAFRDDGRSIPEPYCTLFRDRRRQPNSLISSQHRPTKRSNMSIVP